MHQGCVPSATATAEQSTAGPACRPSRGAQPMGGRGRFCLLGDCGGAGYASKAAVVAGRRSRSLEDPALTRAFVRLHLWERCVPLPSSLP